MSGIDRWLESDETGEDFSHCLCCKLPLAEIAAPWLVNKEYHRGECLQEYAICQPCRDRLSDQLSEPSKAAVRNFLEHEIDWKERLREFMLSHETSARFDACISCRTSRGQLDGFGVSSLFDAGGQLVTGPLPLLICRSCIARMTADLSLESREVWRKFLAENFAGPPDESGFPGFF